jgi:hypothetical protein
VQEACRDYNSGDKEVLVFRRLSAGIGHQHRTSVPGPHSEALLHECSEESRVNGCFLAANFRLYSARMFEEIPPARPAATPSPRTAIAVFGGYFALCLIGLAFVWLRRSTPMSLRAQIAVGQYLVGGVLSGAFLLRVKSVSPEGNGKRMTILVFVVLALQVVNSVLQ